MANIIFGSIRDRRGKNILSIRDENIINENFRRKRFMTLILLFLIHRYNIYSVHYVTPTEANQKQAEGMKKYVLFSEVNSEIGDIIVALVNKEGIRKLLNSDQSELKKLISKES